MNVRSRRAASSYSNNQPLHHPISFNNYVPFSETDEENESSRSGVASYSYPSESETEARESDILNRSWLQYERYANIHELDHLGIPSYTYLGGLPRRRRSLSASPALSIESVAVELDESEDAMGLDLEDIPTEEVEDETESAMEDEDEFMDVRVKVEKKPYPTKSMKVTVSVQPASEIEDEEEEEITDDLYETGDGDASASISYLQVSTSDRSVESVDEVTYDESESGESISESSNDEYASEEDEDASESESEKEEEEKPKAKKRQPSSINVPVKPEGKKTEEKIIIEEPKEESEMIQDLLVAAIEKSEVEKAKLIEQALLTEKAQLEEAMLAATAEADRAMSPSPGKTSSSPLVKVKQLGGSVVSGVSRAVSSAVGSKKDSATEIVAKAEQEAAKILEDAKSSAQSLDDKVKKLEETISTKSVSETLKPVLTGSLESAESLKPLPSTPSLSPPPPNAIVLANVTVHAVPGSSIQSPSKAAATEGKVDETEKSKVSFSEAPEKGKVKTVPDAESQKSITSDGALPEENDQEDYLSVYADSMDSSSDDEEGPAKKDKSKRETEEDRKEVELAKDRLIEDWKSMRRDSIDELDERFPHILEDMISELTMDPIVPILPRKLQEAAKVTSDEGSARSKSESSRTQSTVRSSGSLGSQKGGIDDFENGMEKSRTSSPEIQSQDEAANSESTLAAGDSDEMSEGEGSTGSIISRNSSGSSIESQQPIQQLRPTRIPVLPDSNVIFVPPKFYANQPIKKSRPVSKPPSTTPSASSSKSLPQSANENTPPSSTMDDGVENKPSSPSESIKPEIDNDVKDTETNNATKENLNDLPKSPETNPNDNESGSNKTENEDEAKTPQLTKETSKSPSISQQSSIKTDQSGEEMEQPQDPVAEENDLLNFFADYQSPAPRDSDKDESTESDRDEDSPSLRRKWKNPTEIATTLAHYLHIVKTETVENSVSELIPLLTQMLVRARKSKTDHALPSLIATLSAVRVLCERLQHVKILSGEKALRNVDLSWLIRILCKISADPDSKLRPEASFTLARLVRAAGPELITRPVYFLLVMENEGFGHQRGAQGSKTKAAALDTLTYALLTFPKEEFEDLEEIARWVCLVVMHPHRRVRQAALECIAVIGHCLGSPDSAVSRLRSFIVRESELTYNRSDEEDGSGAEKKTTIRTFDGKGIFDVSPITAISCRIRKRILPLPSPRGLVEYGVKVPTGQDLVLLLTKLQEEEEEEYELSTSDESVQKSDSDEHLFSDGSESESIRMSDLEKAAKEEKVFGKKPKAEEENEHDIKKILSPDVAYVLAGKGKVNKQISFTHENLDEPHEDDEAAQDDKEKRKKALRKKRQKKRQVERTFSEYENDSPDEED